MALQLKPRIAISRRAHLEVQRTHLRGMDAPVCVHVLRAALFVHDELCVFLSRLVARVPYHHRRDDPTHDKSAVDVLLPAR